MVRHRYREPNSEVIEANNMIDDKDDIVLSIQEDLARELPTLAQVKESLRTELDDPEISMFRNIRHMTSAQWDTFNAHSGMFENPIDVIDPAQQLSKKKRRAHARRSYHYKIGRYETSPYYLNYLSNDIVQIPGAIDDTVRNQANRLSLNPKSIFRSWFKMPLYKVETLAAQLVVADEIIHLSHHCQTEASLHIKSELLVLGALAVLSGSVNGFRKLPLVTHICATEHSKFFQKFVKYLFDKRADYIYLPHDELELQAVMKRYEEMGIPGAMGSVDVVHIKWSNCPAGDFNRAKGKQSYPSLAFECISDFDNLSHARSSIRNKE